MTARDDPVLQTICNARLPSGYYVFEALTFAEVVAIRDALTAAGYAIVPREPTGKMMDAGRCAVHDVWSSRGIKDCYKAMLAASEGKG